jgi:hypothetical protein
VTQYKNSVFGFTQTGSSNEFRVTLAVEVTFKDLVKNRELWSGEIVKTANYYVVDVPGQQAQIGAGWTPRSRQQDRGRDPQPQRRRLVASRRRRPRR